MRKTKAVAGYGDLTQNPPIGAELNPNYKELATDRALLNIPPITNYGDAVDESQI